MILIEANEIPRNDILYEYSNPRKAQKNATERYGATIYKSTRLTKKYMILNPETNKYIHFGSLKPAYEDYLKHNDDTRRYKYLKRAMNIKGEWKSNRYSPNTLSILILWN